jgi:PTS system N-acetylglucosamine-specific IIB component
LTPGTLECLGGARNIARLEACPTRLRVEVVNPALVDAAGLYASGVLGVVISGHVIQVVVGGAAPSWAARIEAERAALAASAHP